ncbi:MAG: hypothetical protein WBN20_11975 [Eudoraea sp.]|uniref:hypothetical protein n=1 Tax=Eudoraea sp. TaxID=1979955 RepID=UPI003C71DBBD
MKTNLKFTVLIAFMFATVVGLAKEPKLSSMTEGPSNSLIVELDSKNKKTALKRSENTKPVFRKKGSRLFLNLLNLDGKDVQIKVYDSDNRTLFSEVIENESIVTKAFNFESAHEDRYTVVVKDGKNTYYDYIVVN